MSHGLRRCFWIVHIGLVDTSADQLGIVAGQLLPRHGDALSGGVS
ncbi:hypothetical protein [Nocardia sp. CNY236]|nr:hypothetical protein [Nocardia sp. CNY236]